MKHWNTLTELENQVYRVREFKTLLDLIARATESGVNEKEMQTALYTLLGMIEDIDSKLYSQFHVLWNEIRTDSQNYAKTEENENNSQKRWKKIVDSLQNSQVSAN
jgi:hypothetical protein